MNPAPDLSGMPSHAGFMVRGKLMRVVWSLLIPKQVCFFLLAAINGRLDMKTLQLITSLALALSINANAQNAEPVVTDAPVEAIFIPSGFDDNDNVEVVLHGTFPDACHRVGNATAEVDADKGRITISASTVVNPDEYCVQSMTPYIHPVSLGKLEQGAWQVVYAKNPEIMESLRYSGKCLHPGESGNRQTGSET
jgi:hypothetical protein